MTTKSTPVYLVANVLNSHIFQRYTKAPGLRITGYKLLDLVGDRMDLGVGSRFTRSIWDHWGDNCYYTLTKVVPYNSLKGGVAYGIKTWRGISAKQESKIGCILKRQWRELRDLPLVYPLPLKPEFHERLVHSQHQKKIEAKIEAK